jgi:hemerythrin superfamily protein
MNVIDLLKKDHETVSALFKDYEAAKEAESENEKRSIVERVLRELTAHAEVEEELFYPAVEERAEEDEKADRGLKEAHEEHRLVKLLVSELGRMRAGDGQFDAKVKVLKDVVEHHVEEEEGELMPRARKLLSSEKLEELGGQVEQRKEELRRQPARARRAPRSGRRTAARGRRRRGPSARASGARASSR